MKILSLSVDPELESLYGFGFAQRAKDFVASRCKDVGLLNASIEIANPSLIQFVSHQCANLPPKPAQALRIAVSDISQINSSTFNQLLTTQVDAHLSVAALTLTTDLSQSFNELFNQTILEYFNSP